MKALVEKVLIGGPWSLDIDGKGHIFPDDGPFSSERVRCSNSRYVLMLWFQVCWVEGEQEFGSGYSWRSKFSSLDMVLLFWSAVFEK